MCISKTLIGNSGDKVYIKNDYVYKEAGFNIEKFKQQTKWLEECTHPNFIKISRLNDTKFRMKKYPTFYDYINEVPLDESIQRFESLLDVVDSFPSKPADVRINKYFHKLSERTGYTYSGEFDASSNWGFVHGDLTISNILIDRDPKLTHKQSFIFIDPRGTEEQNYYDYGKLMQSFEMYYELFINDDLDNIKYMEFCDSAKQIMYERYDKYQLDFFLAVHLLGAVPFFIKNGRNELAELFLNKGHQIFDELNITYKNESN